MPERVVRIFIDLPRRGCVVREGDYVVIKGVRGIGSAYQVVTAHAVNRREKAASGS